MANVSRSTERKQGVVRVHRGYGYICPKCRDVIMYDRGKREYFCWRNECNFRETREQYKHTLRDILYVLGMRDAAREHERMTGVVYYIRFRDAIKIGTTTQPEGRLAELPWEEVLGFEPGGLTTERLRHSQFNAHQICGEWFHDNSELRQHIAAINQSHQEWQRKRFVNASPFPWDRKVATRWMRQPA